MTMLTVGGINPYIYSSPEIKTFDKNDRREMTKELFVNDYKTRNKEGLVTVAGLGASLLAADYVAKTGIAQKAITGAAKKVATSKVGQVVIAAVKDLATTVAPFAKKAALWWTALPAPAKAVAIAGAAVTAIAAGIIKHKGAKNAGKIEQKYADMAALNK